MATFLSGTRSKVGWLWAHLRKSEIFWAVIVGLPLAGYFALEYDRSEPPPYRIYVFIGPRMPNSFGKARDKLLNAKALRGLQINGRKVVLEPEDIYYESNSTSEEAMQATRKAADKVLRQQDALAIIGILDSTPTEELIRVLFKQRPQIPFIATVQSDDDLLQKCIGKECDDGSGNAPLLQLSPTNAEQARWAIQFAIDKQIKSFLIVKDDETSNETYVTNLVEKLKQAIDASNNVNHTGLHKDIVSLNDLRTNRVSVNVPCWLYAGGIDGAVTLLSLVKASKSPTMVILSDAAVPAQPPNGEEAQSFGLVDKKNHPVGELMDQSDAAEFNRGMNAYGMDAVAIASQLIDDLNQRGLDVRLRVASKLHVDNVGDVRRNLLRVMRQNHDFRSSYLGARETEPVPGLPTVYSFSGFRRSNGIFHVWEWDPKNSAFKDVDNWHPRRVVVMAPQ